MAQPLRIPTVTPDDLFTFHLKAYGRPFQSPALSPPILSTSSEVEQDDDGLGYYPDGVKRTLTDAEIAIFRHSELHAIQRQRELELEQKALETDSDDIPSRPTNEESRSEGEVSEDEPLANGDIHRNREAETPSRATKLSSTSTTEPMHVDGAKCPPDNDKSVSADQTSEGEDEDEAAYAEFLRHERKEFEFAARRQRKQLKRDWAQLDPYNRSISTRRRVRELDYIEQRADVLDYGDESNLNDATSATVVDATPAEAKGRKIWWPELGVKVKFFEGG